MCIASTHSVARYFGGCLLSLVPALTLQGSVSLVPGGIAEMFLWEENREVIKILDRKGFVRIAVEQGVPLVPVYHFGNSKLFRCDLRVDRLSAVLQSVDSAFEPL